MKKVYTFIVVLLLTPLFISAQDNVLGDFEDGTQGGWASWGGDVTVVDNPQIGSIVNGSSKVLKYEPSEGYKAIAYWNTGIVSGDYVSIKVDVYMETAGDIQLSLGNSVSEGAGYTKTLSVDAGEWTTLSFDISTLMLRDYQQLAFQNVAVQDIYFDNIILVAGELGEIDPNTQILNNFEDGAIDNWGSWQESATISVIDNPVSDAGLNASQKVASLVSTEEWGSFKKWFGDAGFAVKEPSTLSVLIYSSVATQIKLQLDNPIISDNDDFEEYKDIIADEWNLVVFDLTTLEDYGYKQIAFQPEHAGTFYFDDITLTNADLTSTRAIENKDTSKVYASKNQIKVDNCFGQNVVIYAISGMKIYEQKATSSSITTNVQKGLYIVVVDNISTKVLVK